MNSLQVMLLTFLAVSLAVWGIYSILSDLYLRDRSRFSQRVDEEFRQRLRDQARRSSLFKNLGAGEAENLVTEEEQPGLWQRFVVMVEQSGSRHTPNWWLALMGYCALMGMALGAFGLSNVLASVVGTLVGASLPWLCVYLMRKSRQDKLLSQLPDTFDLISRVIRAGQTVPQAMQAVADEFDQPIAGEFSYCYEQQNLGLPPDEAWHDLARRTGLLEIKIFVLAMLVQQQAGGNLAELLDKLSAVVRDRFRIRGKIKALTAEGRFQALILLSLPPLLFLLILFLNRNYGQVLLDHPNLLYGTFTAEAVGALWIRKIVNFDF